MKVIWLAPPRIIPGEGEIETGEEREISDDLAAKFINQGEAKPLPQPVKKTTKEHDL